MRLAAYAGASTVLAAGIVLRAFHERPNFYSATVYLAQSSACRMILLNLLLLTAYGAMRALQKVLYGPLRAIEREQLWDKAWYAVTETALAMTTFRDEVGAWFFVMFISLLAGKVWGWLSEARVEALEQQPPANPRIFHIRLTVSLALSEIFDFLMLRYCVQNLLDQPRPGMMVMFAFEFAVLAITSTSTTLKYVLSLQEKFIVRKQTKARIEERRLELRTAWEEAQRRTESGPDGHTPSQPTAPAEEEVIDESEIDVPGWQEKGRWVLFLDLLTDLLKLLVYMCFFTILLMFHGIPIHIIRDVFLTTRSFLKRIADFLKYRNATKDMNARYPDATQEELARDGTCIICREEMRPWQEPPAQGAGDAANRRPNRMLLDERQRPKKLPCGHILHFGCLRSWLERQQVCPTCRNPVLSPTTNRGAANMPGGGQGPQPPGQQPGGVQQPNQNRPGARPGARRARTFNLGPYRIAFAAGDEQQVRDALQALRDDHQGAGQLRQALHGAQPTTVETARLGSGIVASQVATYATGTLQDQIARLEEQFQREFNNLAVAEQQLAVVRGLQQELGRLRTTAVANLGGDVPTTRSSFATAGQQPRTLPFAQPLRFHNQGLASTDEQQVLSAGSDQVALGFGHPELPTGFALPPGWTLLPLRQSGSPGPHSMEQERPNITIESIIPQLPFNADRDVAPSQRQPGTTDTPHFSTAADTATNNSISNFADSRTSAPESAHGQPSETPSLTEQFPSPEQAPAPRPNAVQQDEPEPMGDIPKWGDSAQSPAVVRPSDPDLESEEAASDGPSKAHGNDDVFDAKGKGKAVTVEDVKDDDDG